MKLNNLKIAPKLGILVGVTLFGLCAAGVLAGYLMQREMLNARIDQAKAIVDMARNMAVGLQKQVEAGQLTKEAAIAEFGRRANSMTYDNGAGYLFGTTYDGITRVGARSEADRHQPHGRRDQWQEALPRIDGRRRPKGEILLYYEYVKPGRTSRSARSAMPSRSPASTCMSAPAPISTISTPR